ncbi:MAG: LPS assembly protein LptD [Pedobacter sp.]
MKLIRLLLLFVCLAMPPIAVCNAAVNLPAGEGIAIKADNMDHDQANDTFNARGNVIIESEGMVLTAKQASYNRSTGIMIATGGIVMTKGEDILRGEKLTIDVATGRVELDHGTLNVRKGNITFSGEKIIREDESKLRLYKTELTTCDLPNPSWKFGAEELNVNLLGYAIGRNVIFYIKDKPAIYLPWIAFPVVRDRKSGILFPRFGYSNTRGAQVDIPVYWVIAPNQDALFDLDLQSKRGIGIGAEYRYARKRSSEGSINGYLIYDLLDERWRGQIAQNHKEIFAPDMNLRTSINLTTDRSFLSDFGEKSGDYNRQSNDSTANFLKTWQHYALTANMRYIDDLYAGDNKQTLQTLPEIGLAAVRQQIGATPLYFDLDTSATNFYREAGPSGQRLHAFPRLTLAPELPEYLHASAFFGAHLRAYATDRIPEKSSIKGSDGDILPEIGARFSSSFNRIFTIDGEYTKKLRHEIVPEITYSFTPDRDQARLPFYDYSDRLVLQNIVYYSITNHLGGKFKNGETTEYRDLMRLKLMQGYSFEGTRRDLLTLVDANRHLTDVILESDTWLHPKLRLTLDGRYNVYDRQLSRVAPGVEFDDKRGSTAAASYSMSRNEVEYMEARLSTKLVKPWIFGYTTRYSFDRPGFLESTYSAEYRHQCWSVNLSLSDRPGNTSFHVNFNLIGLTGS